MYGNHCPSREMITKHKKLNTIQTPYVFLYGIFFLPLLFFWFPSSSHFFLSLISSTTTVSLFLSSLQLSGHQRPPPRSKNEAQQIYNIKHKYGKKMTQNADLEKCRSGACTSSPEFSPARSLSPVVVRLGCDSMVVKHGVLLPDENSGDGCVDR